MIKGKNMWNAKEYAELIKKGNPDFVECKGYMFVGASRQRLSIENMPFHEDVVEFSKELIKYLQGYEIVSEHIVSRAILIAKKKFKRKGKWFIGIDFKKFFSGEEDYSKEIKDIGLSGKGTKDRMRRKDEKLDSRL